MPSVYCFKRLTVVPNAKDFVDAVLSKTQRKTPTVVHRHYPIPKIRAFYMRKIKFCQQTLHDKITQIIGEFPKIDDIHPFYEELMNVLYDKDHYKLALGGLNIARELIDRVANEYCRMIKYADALYRCKTLKKAALGRMVKIIRNQKENLDFLETVRKHLSRLPSIDPNMRSLVLCGFPNVGKSSFLNKVTRADVEVQPYPFTTKSLYVGHADYKYLTWQVIDTPGILDHKIDAANKIECTTITALAYLKAAVLYFMDISEQCGYTLQQQKDLLDHNKPLFRDKPLIVCLNKVDVRNMNTLSESERSIFDSLKAENIPVVALSTLTDEGVMELKSVACDTLLDFRINSRIQASGGRKIESNKIYIAMPKTPSEARPPCIPEAVLAKRRPGKGEPQAPLTGKKRKLERDIEHEQGDDYILNLQKNWLLKNEDHKNDIIPEIWEGHNIQDFLHPSLLEKKMKLEIEEAHREKAGLYDESESEDDNEEIIPGYSRIKVKKLAKKIREARQLRILESRSRKSVRKAKLPRTGKKIKVESIEEGMDKLGVDIDADESQHLSRARSRSQSKSVKRHPVIPDPKKVEFQERTRSRSRSRTGVRDEVMEAKVNRMAKVSQRTINQNARKGEADRRVFDLKPKHLFSGKRSIGKTQRR